MSEDVREMAARIAILTEALRPFAEAAGQFRADDADTMRPASVQARHYRNAAALLGLPFVPHRAI